MDRLNAADQALVGAHPRHDPSKAHVANALWGAAVVGRAAPGMGAMAMVSWSRDTVTLRNLQTRVSDSRQSGSTTISTTRRYHRGGHPRVVDADGWLCQAEVAHRDGLIWPRFGPLFSFATRA